MHADQFTDPSGSRGSCVSRRLNSTDIAAHKDSHVSRADVFLSDQLNIRSLDHRIRCLDGAYESFSLDHSECF
jgi:hypothetical protein